MPTFAKLAGVELPKEDRGGQPTIFDGYDMSPVLFGTGKSERKSVVLLHRGRAEPRCRPHRPVQGRLQPPRRRRGPDRRPGRRLNLGWKGPRSYVAIVPQIFDLWADPQERYDLFMNNFTEKTWFRPRSRT